MKYTKFLYTLLYLSFIIVTQPAHAAFSPSSISGLQLWFSADTGVYADTSLTLATSTDGAKVKGWVDQSGHNNNATQTNAVNAPTLKLNQVNGLPALRFDAAFSQYLVHTYSGEPATVIVVGKEALATPNNDTWLGADTSDPVAVGAYYFKAGNGGLDLEFIRSISGDTGGSSFEAVRHIGTVNNAWYIQSGTNGASTISLWKNSVKIAQNSTTTPRLPIKPGTTVIGSAYYADSLNGSFLTGDIAEILVYDNALSDSQMAQVHQYLSTKYNLAYPESPDTRPTYVFPSFDAYEQLRILYSSDGIHFSEAQTRLDATSRSVRDPDLFYANGSYWIAYTTSAAGGFSTSTAFAVAKSATWNGAYTQVASVDVSAAIPGVTRVWSPIHFVDPSDGTLHILFSAATSSAADNFRQYHIEPTNSSLTSWNTPVEIGGAVTAYSNLIAGYIAKKNSTYYLWAKDDSATTTGGKYNIVLSSPSPFSGYTTYKSGNWAGWGQHKYEGAYPLKINSSTWRVYFDNYGGVNSESYSESTDDWATWSAPLPVTNPFPGARNGIILFTSASISASPSSLAPNVTATINLTGTGTSWITGVATTPTFTLSGNIGATIISQSIIDSTHATVTIAAASQNGTVVITDPSSNASVELYVSSGIVSSGGGGTQLSPQQVERILGPTPNLPFTPPTITTNTPSFTRNLTVGSSGNDVLNLQKYLNAKGFTVALSGPGSKGKETNLFGGLTKQAIIKFQKAKNISPAIGYFGPLTRAYITLNP